MRLDNDGVSKTLFEGSKKRSIYKVEVLHFSDNFSCAVTLLLQPLVDPRSMNMPEESTVEVHESSSTIYGKRTWKEGRL